MLGFQWKGKKYIYGRVAFGTRCGSRLFSSVSLTVNWLLKHIFLCPITFTYCDDFLLISADDDQAQILAAVFELVMQLLGIPLQKEKSIIGKIVITFLGIEMDAELETLALPEKRKQSLKRLLKKWSDNTQMTVHELRSLTGVLACVCRSCPPGKLFLRRLYNSIAYCDSEDLPEHWLIDIGSEMKKDIHWWQTIAPHLEKMSMRIIDLIFSVIVHTDASDFGGAGFCRNPLEEFEQYFQVKWENDLKYMRKDSACINCRELFACVAMALTFAQKWKNQRVLFRCDNMAATQAVLAGTSKNKKIMNLLRVLAMVAALNQFTYRFEWLAGAENVVADFLSREEQEKIDTKYPKLQRVAAVLPPRTGDAEWELSTVAAWQAQLLHAEEE